MNWYYVEQGSQAGPVPEEQFHELMRAGKILPHTLVWREGMADWLPYSQASHLATAAPSDIAKTVVCAECGKLFPAEETITYGDLRVCGACKPIFLQKLSEGAPLQAGALNYAGFWVRFGAYFVDGLILMAFNVGVGVVAGFTLAQSAGFEPRGVLAVQLGWMSLQLAAALAYEGLLVGKYGATLGKMICGLKIVTADGGRVSYPRAFARYLGKMLSTFTCFIGFIIAAFDGQKRALHDYLCNTRVVFK